LSRYRVQSATAIESLTLAGRRAGGRVDHGDPEEVWEVLDPADRDEEEDIKAAQERLGELETKQD
jgi:hypothetical protein